MVLPWTLVLSQLPGSFASGRVQGVMGTPGTRALSKIIWKTQGEISASLAAVGGPGGFPEQWDTRVLRDLGHGTACPASGAGAGDRTLVWAALGGLGVAGGFPAVQFQPWGTTGVPSLHLGPLRVPGCPLQGRSELIKEARVLLPTLLRLRAHSLFLLPSLIPLASLPLKTFCLLSLIIACEA